MTDVCNLYKQHKQQHIRMNNDIIRVSNYKSYRALESDDFIVNNVQLDPFVVTTLNAMYKHPMIFDIPVNDCVCKYDIIKNIVQNHTKYIVHEQEVSK